MPKKSLVNSEAVETQKEEEKKTNSMLDRYIIFSFSCVILYTIVSFILVVKTGLTMDVLTSCVFGLFGGELLACAMIKRFKLKEERSGGSKE